MNSGIKTNILIGLVSCLILVSSGLAVAEDAVIAKVGDVPITVYELEREMHRILPLNSSFHSSVSPEKAVEVRSLALDNLIDQAYKVRYARSQNISVEQSALEERLKTVYSTFKSEEELQKALGKESITAFRASVYRMLVAKKAEAAAVNSQADYSEEELQRLYKENSFMYQLPKEYRVSHVLIKVDPTLVGKERDLLVAKAEDIAKRAKNGEDFYNLAYYNSDEDSKFVGGDIGYFYSGQTVKEFDEVVKTMEIDDIVGPVETISGFHIIKLTDVREARVMTFEEARQKIKTTFEEKKRAKLYDLWMAGLKSQLNAEIIHPDLK